MRDQHTANSRPGAFVTVAVMLLTLPAGRASAQNKRKPSVEGGSRER